MRNLVKYLIFFALIAVIIYGYLKLQKYETLSSVLLKENLELKGEEAYIKLRKKVDVLEAENKLLKDQIFQLENQQFLFNSNDDKEEDYKLEDNLRFKDDTKDLKKELEQSQELKDEEGYKINPSIEFDQEKRTIDGINVEVETKF